MSTEFAGYTITQWLLALVIVIVIAGIISLMQRSKKGRNVLDKADSKWWNIFNIFS